MYVIFHRPDGSSITFTGNTANFGNFPEQGGGQLATLTHNTDYTWTLHDEDATTQVYSGNGLAGALLQSIVDASGVGWSITYDGLGRPTRVTHTNGTYFTIARQGSSQNGITTVQATLTDPAGNVYQYGYSTAQAIGLQHVSFQLNSLTLPGSPATAITYKYSANSAPGGFEYLTEEDYNGAPYFNIAYDSTSGRATGSQLADGSEAYSIIYTYPATGQMQAAVTNALGHTTTKQYNTSYGGQYLLTSNSDTAVSDCGATANSIAYDSNGYVHQTVDNNNITHIYNYATNGQLQNETEGYNTATPRTTTYIWDPNQQLNRLTSVTVKGTVNYNKTVYGYNAQNRLASVAVTNLTPYGTANQTLTTSYTYTLYGNGMVQQMVVTAPSPSGTDKVTTNYDTLGNITTVVDGLGHTTTYSNYNALGEAQKVVGANGDETDYTYDARGRVATKTTHPYGVATTWTYTYDGYGLLYQVSAPDGEVTTWNRDAEMRVNTITHNDKDGTSTETFGYDDNNDITSDKITRGTDVGKLITYVYDGLGRIYQVKGNHGQVLTYAYDGNGNVLSVTDALTHQTSYTYDALNRVSTMTDAKNGVTHYSYNAGDQVLQVIDPRNLTTSYTWDGLGLLWKQVSPDTGTTSFNYDTYGRLATKTRADSLQTTYAYDSLNRLASRSSNGNTRTYTWDTCTNGKGRLCTAINQGFNSVGYSYTPEGWLAGRSFVISGGPTYSLGYSYNAMGQLSVLVYPDGNQALYSYTDGAVSQVNLQVGSYLVTGVNGIVYRPMDLAMSNWTSYNGLTNTIAYDNDLRPTSISVPGIQSLGFTYDNADRINTITNGIDGTMSQTLGYDELNRLKTVSSTADNESFNYDADGNRASGVVNGVSTTYTTPSTSNRLGSTSGGMSASYGYDAQGNLTTIDGSTVYTYGPFGELADAGGMSYKHGADGQRLLKSGAPGTTYFAPDASGTLLAEEQGSTWMDYVWLNGRLVTVIANGGVFPLHDDQTGRPQVMTDPQNHNIDWASQNKAFDRTVTTNVWGNFNIGFPGQYLDTESGLWQNGYRDYNASLGRYVESDPIGLDGGLNTYIYVQDNPVIWTDPLGLKVMQCRQPAFGWMPIDHDWIKTDTIEAGMGGTRGNEPGNQSGDLPYDPVQVTDHTGRSKEKGASCKEVPNVDEQRVNDQLRIGLSLGRWTPFNQCHSFVNSVLDKAQIHGASGSWGNGGASGGW